MAATLRKTFVKIAKCDKDPDSVFVLGRPAKENRHSEKFPSTFNVLRKEREANPSLLLHLLKLEISSLISGRESRHTCGLTHRFVSLSLRRLWALHLTFLYVKI
jgi:hypothetical protein